MLSPLRSGAAREPGNQVIELSPTGATLGTFTTGTYPYAIAFDGTHMWVTNSGTEKVTEL